VCLGKALAELEIQLLAVGLHNQLTLELEGVQDLSLRVIPSLKPAQGPRAGPSCFSKRSRSKGFPQTRRTAATFNNSSH
jgi:hypothetical protein